MKYMCFFAGVILFVILAHARNVVQAHWESVCAVSQGRELTVITARGGKVRGYCCRSTANDKLTIEKNGERVSIARTDIAHIRMRVSVRRATSDMGDQIALTLAIGVWRCPRGTGRWS